MTHYHPRPLFGLLLSLALLSGCATYPLMQIPVDLPEEQGGGSATYSLARKGSSVALYAPSEREEKLGDRLLRLESPFNGKDWITQLKFDICQCPEWPNCCPPQFVVLPPGGNGSLPDFLIGQTVKQITIFPGSNAGLMQTTTFGDDNSIRMQREWIDASDSRIREEADTYQPRSIPDGR